MKQKTNGKNADKNRIQFKLHKNKERQKNCFIETN